MSVSSGTRSLQRVTASPPTMNFTDTNMSAMQLAACEVFDTTELLEAILLQLPLWAIIRLQRVSRNFRHVIANSPRLQAALFMKRKHSESFINGRNPLLTSLSEPNGMSPYYLARAWNSIDGVPKLFSKLDIIEPWAEEPYWALSFNIGKRRTKNMAFGVLSKEIRSSAMEGPWKDMVLQNPSGLDIMVRLSRNALSGEKRFAAGVTLGEVHCWLLQAFWALDNACTLIEVLGDVDDQEDEM